MDFIKFNNINNNSIFLKNLKSYMIIDFLINGDVYGKDRQSWILPSNVDANSFLKYKGTVNFSGLQNKDIGVFELSFGNTNWAFFMQFVNSNSVQLFTNIYEPSKGIKITIRKKKFELDYLNFYGFPSESHYSFKGRQDSIIKLKTVQANLEPFYKLWDLFKIIKENVPSVVGEIYNASFYRLNKNERIAQPIILQLLGKRVSYYTSARMSMKKQRESENEMRNAVKIIETVNDLTVREVMISYQTKCKKVKPLSMHLMHLLYNTSYENLKFADFFSKILKNKSIIIAESDVMNLYDLVRTVADLKPCTLNSIKSIQGTHIMVQPSTFISPTAKYGKTKRKLNNNDNRSINNTKRRKSLMNYKNRNGMLNGKIGKINDVINKGVNYMIILKFKENNKTQVFMGDYDHVLQNIKSFINFDKMKYLQYYVNKNGIKNKLNIKIKDVFDMSKYGLVNNKDKFAATINTLGQDGKSLIKSETITGSFYDLKTQLDRMINNKLQMNFKKENHDMLSNSNNNQNNYDYNNYDKNNSNNYWNR